MVAIVSKCKQMVANAPLILILILILILKMKKGCGGKTREKRLPPTPTPPTGQETGKFKSCLFFCTFFTTEKKTLLAKKHLKLYNTRRYLLILVKSINCS